MGIRRAQRAIADSDLPQSITRDSEFTAADTVHANASDPHPQYLLQSEGDVRYRLTSVALVDAEIPSTIARDAEVTAAINAHLTVADPHSQYLLQSEGDVRYRQNAVAFTDSDIPSTIARDTEVTAAIAAHTSASDPHSQYLLHSEGDARYIRGLTLTFSIDLPNMAPNQLEKRFFTLTGTKPGDFALMAPINTNLFANASWPFLYAAVIESVDTVACYFRNDNTASVDLGSMSFRVVVMLF
jgi:hypothetical protein